MCLELLRNQTDAGEVLRQCLSVVGFYGLLDVSLVSSSFPKPSGRFTYAQRIRANERSRLLNYTPQGTILLPFFPGEITS